MSNLAEWPGLVESSNEIDRDLRTWWKTHPKKAKQIAFQVVEFAMPDTYVDEVTFDVGGGIEVRVLTFCDIKKDKAIFEIIVNRLKAVFGSQVTLWCIAGEGVRFGDEICD